jgi:hypothetical protein
MCRPFVDGRPVPFSSTSAGSTTLLALLSGASSPKRTARVTRTGADDGVVIDMGSLLLLTFTDPDGGIHEVVWMKPDIPVEATAKRADWTMFSSDGDR